MASTSISKLSLNEDFFPFHLVNDKKTEMYVKFAKVMVICQGAYAEKRKRLIKEMQDHYKSASRVLSDKTYCEELRTHCDAEKTEEFYKYFKSEVQTALESGFNLVYIDTSMSSLKQNEYYCSVANKTQYVILIFPPVVTERKLPSEIGYPDGTQATKFAKLGVNLEAPNMFQHLFCAWFLHDIDTEELRNECALYVNDLFEQVEEFGKWFSKVGDASLFPKHFGLTKDDVKKEELQMREDIAFCPVKVFGSEYEMSKYFENPAVRDNYGKMSKLLIVGFVITPYVVAARVKLTHKQKDLWDMNDDVKEDAYVESNLPTDLYLESKSSLPPPVPDVKRICSKSNTTLIRGDYIHEPEKLIPPRAKGRSCHIVLGTAPGASKADIDLGVAFALSREQAAFRSKVEIELEDFDKFQCKKIGKYWLVYLKDTIIVNGIFASCVKPLAFDTQLQMLKKRDTPLQMSIEKNTKPQILNKKDTQLQMPKKKQN